MGQDILTHQWVVRIENLPADYCSVIEGGITPGEHKLLRFTVMSPNIGDTDIHVGDPQAHIDANDGLYEFATCHQHYHFRHYAKYELVDPQTGHVWRAAKQGFCILDTDPNPAYYGQPPREGKYRNCGSTATAGFQGITAGWADTYRFDLGGQFFVLDEGDGQAPVPPGDYVIRITVNPPFTAQQGEPCPHTDTVGGCHQLPESDYTNNVTEVLVTIPDNPGKRGVGPLSGTPVSNREIVDHCEGEK